MMGSLRKTICTVTVIEPMLRYNRRRSLGAIGKQSGQFAYPTPGLLRRLRLAVWDGMLAAPPLYPGNGHQSPVVNLRQTRGPGRQDITGVFLPSSRCAWACNLRRVAAPAGYLVNNS